MKRTEFRDALQAKAEAHKAAEAGLPVEAPKPAISVEPPSGARPRHEESNSP